MNQYFTDGMLIGDCLLKEECPEAHINAYILPDRVLFLLMNTANAARPIDFRIDLKPWLNSASGKYEVRAYDQFGAKSGADTAIGNDWSRKTSQLRNMDFAIYEFLAK